MLEMMTNVLRTIGLFLGFGVETVLVPEPKKYLFWVKWPWRPTKAYVLYQWSVDAEKAQPSQADIYMSPEINVWTTLVGKA